MRCNIMAPGYVAVYFSFLVILQFSLVYLLCSRHFIEHFCCVAGSLLSYRPLLRSQKRPNVVSKET
jgi:hypothetical protein